MFSNLNNYPAITNMACTAHVYNAQQIEQNSLPIFSISQAFLLAHMMHLKKVVKNFTQNQSVMQGAIKILSKIFGK